MTQRGSASSSRSDVNKKSSGLVVSLLLLVFLALVAAKWHSTQIIDRAMIVGASDLSVGAVHDVVDSCVKHRRTDLELCDVRREIEKIPFVRSAHVYYSDVRSITAEVYEREPIAHVVTSSGELRYIDADARVLPAVAVRTSHCVPLIRGTKNLSSSKLADAVKLVSTAKNILEPCLFSSISEFVVDASGMVTVLTDGHHWKLGDVTNVNAVEACSNMNVFWSRVGTNKNLTNLSIDLRWRNHVVVQNMGKES